MLIFTVTLLFALSKLQKLFLKSHPIIHEFVDKNAFGPEEKVNTGSDGFQIAVAMNNYVG